MNSIDFMYYVSLSAMCILTYETLSLAPLQPLRREIRFTKYDLRYSNESFGTVLECSIKQYPGKQAIFVHTIIHEKITNFNVKISVSKCKDYYVDCVNVVSYEITDICSKLHLLMTLVDHVNTDQQIVKKCPIFGEYYYRNLTFKSDTFGSIYGLPAEKWWEHYWKMNLKFYNPEKTANVFVNMEFYFIQLRNRNRKN